MYFDSIVNKIKIQINVMVPAYSPFHQLVTFFYLFTVMSSFSSTPRGGGGGVLSFFLAS